jgi:hypothetical protein
MGMKYLVLGIWYEVWVWSVKFGWTIFFKISQEVYLIQPRSVAQMARVRASDARGRRFKSCHSDKKALIVQRIEQRFPKPSIQVRFLVRAQ